ncbi:Transcriptional regulatory protein moc3 [Lachnellula suecica]|uniref:Transcriptional regulatory protein moc3 n=1 Tax=Lachnellula suecica TaxID=602035 RepID=A0A8T9C1A1_9HELO|nr:Transcriptional regulatory protein moc3 [Lachnellula suecica]
MRSRTGCQTCRQRKLKCDESKPICGQCRKGSRECQPSDGVVFRHQQNASMNGAPGTGEVDEGNGKLGGFYAYRNTFDEHNVWVDVPKIVTFHNVLDPFNMEPTPEPEYHPASPPIPAPRIDERPENNSYYNMQFDQASGLEALSAAATSNMQYARPFSAAAQSPLDAITSPHSSNNLNFILNPTGPDGSIGVASPPIDPSLITSHPSPQNDPKPVEDFEVAFLMRHFGETAGQWSNPFPPLVVIFKLSDFTRMDLFDLGCYFAHHVPVQAISNPLLKYSACAYAAKQLGRVGGRKAAIGGLVTRQGDMERYPRPESVDWAYIGAKYYDLAISLLMGELSNSGNQDIPMTPITAADETFSPQASVSSPRTPGNKRRRLSRPASANNADETVAAAAILCVYEFLDNANTAWARHLSGTKSLFDMAEREDMMPVRSPTSPGALSERIKPSRARKATFWNFARQDFLAAFINEGQTRLNTEDIGLWRAAGLLLDDQGFVIPSNSEDSQFPERQLVMREDMISNALIWLMSKIINYLASGDSVDHVFPQNRGSPVGFIGINQMVLLERWKELEKELDIWHKGLPDTFKPCARLPPITDGSVPADSPRATFSEIWYSMSMCASTMQSYHMARTILLINKPHESTARRSTISNRLTSYRSIETEVRHHTHEICGIALGRPEGSVRIHQVQPLFVAGQCLTDNRERRIVLDLLRGVESDLGWATDYRVKKLLKEWNWDQPPT